MPRVVAVLLACLVLTGAIDIVRGHAQDAPHATDPTPANFWQRDHLVGDWGGLRDRLKDAGIELGLEEEDEGWANLQGGLRRAATYDGLATASLRVDLAKLAGWDGATLFANAYQIHGRGPTPNLVGNLQTISSIEATRSVKLYDLWVEQSLWDQRLNIRVGQQGASDELMLAEFASVFLNSSFGYPSLNAFALPASGPNYPLATPMVRVRLKASDHVTLVGAVFNGDPAPPGAGDPQGRDASGTAFRLNDHALSFLELWYITGEDALKGTYKLGGWYESGHFADLQRDATGRSLADPQSTGAALEHRANYAVYAVANQMVWHSGDGKDRGIGVFGLVIGAPGDRNLSDLFVMGGATWTGPFPGRDSDIAGLGLAYAHVSGAEQALGRAQQLFGGGGTGFRGEETVLEATYQYQVAPWWTLQPDLQYVINPGAALPNPARDNQPVALKNALVIGVRSAITF
jgi:porin